MRITRTTQVLAASVLGLSLAGAGLAGPALADDEPGSGIDVSVNIQPTTTPGQLSMTVADATKKNRWVAITLDGRSNKQPSWVVVPVARRPEGTKE